MSVVAARWPSMLVSFLPERYFTVHISAQRMQGDRVRGAYDSSNKARPTQLGSCMSFSGTCSDSMVRNLAAIT